MIIRAAITLSILVPSLVASADDRPIPTIPVGGTVEATMPASSDRPSLYFAIDSDESGSVTVEMSSLHFDCGLAVYREDQDEQLQLVAADSDGGVATNSRVSFEAETGNRYRIEAWSALDWGGPFELAVVRDAPQPIDAARQIELDRAYWDAVRKEGERTGSELLLAWSEQGRGLAAYERGDYAAAAKLVDSAVLRVTTALGKESATVAGWLSHSAGAHMELGQLPEARIRLERSLRIRESVFGTDHPEFVNALSGLAAVSYRMADYRTASELFERVLKVHRESSSSPTLLADTLSNLAAPVRKLGQYDRAEELLREALTVLENADAPDPRSLGVVLNNLASLLRESGRYLEARDAFERALSIDEAQFGRDHPRTATTWNNYGLLLQAMGDYTAARAAYDRALTIRIDRFGRISPYTATTLGNLGNLMTAMGAYDEAIDLHREAVDVTREAMGGEHPRYSQAVSNLAVAYDKSGDPARAEPLYQQVLDIRTKALGPEHPLTGMAWANLGAVTRDKGDLARSRELYERAHPILERALGPDHRQTVYVLVSIASLNLEADRYDEARRQMLEALPVIERVRGPEHPEVAELLEGLAKVEWESGHPDRAFDYAVRREAIGRDHLRLVARGMAEREALSYARVRHSELDGLVSIALEAESSVQTRRRVWDAVIRSRALVLDEVGARRQSSAASPDPQIRRLAEDVESARSRLANLVVRGPGRQPREIYEEVLARARQSRDRAEALLAEKSAGFAASLVSAEIGAADVSSALPKESAFVSYLRFTNRLNRARDEYVAMVLRFGDDSPQVIGLGSAGEIDRLVEMWRRQSGPEGLSSESAARTSGVRLRKKVWDPLKVAIGGARRVFVVPDGSLQLINLTGLPSSRDRYLVETGPLIQHLSIERDLVRRERPAADRLVLALGGPSFDSEVRSRGETGAVYRGQRTSCPGFLEHQFEPLTGALLEARQIAQIAEDKAGEGAETTLLVGAEATESAFKRLAGGHRIIHLATHGFFLGEGCETGASVRGIGAVAEWDGIGSSDRPAIIEESPLLLSGLALAGANRRVEAGPDQEDGILTAEEVMSLDLSRVEWAVMSGCQTGVGSLQEGEGVFWFAPGVSSSRCRNADHESLVRGRRSDAGLDDGPVRGSHRRAARRGRGCPPSQHRHS